MDLMLRRRESHNVLTGDARVSAEALTLDTLRAARNLQLDRTRLQRVLGADRGFVDALFESEEVVQPASAPGARALLLVRLNRALGDVFGSVQRALAWLESDEAELGGRPAELLLAPGGLERVLRHMEMYSSDYAW